MDSFRSRIPILVQADGIGTGSQYNFFLIGIGAGYVLDIVSLPFNLIIEKILNESEVLVLGIALFIVSLIFWTAVQALIATWSEAGNYQLYSERH